MTRSWIRDRGLTLALVAISLSCWAAQLVLGWHVENGQRLAHGASALTFAEYLRGGDAWEATFENWESEFLQMGAFVWMTVMLVQKGSAESRRPGAVELVDADPRSFRDAPDAPSHVRAGGWRLWLYERSLGLAFMILFAFSFAGHALGGWRADVDERLLDGEPARSFAAFWTSPDFWFQSLQNWQSEFLAIAAMVWLSVYLRHRGSPESKPVHAPHGETGR
jgi:hypothetical protein